MTMKAQSTILIPGTILKVKKKEAVVMNLYYLFTNYQVANVTATITK